MVTFHTTIKLKHYKHIIRAPFDASLLDEALTKTFPNRSVQLVDSGRSALALAIEELGLRGKKLILPSYICNVLLPVLAEYNIEPIFLDITKETYAPAPDSYTDEMINNADAVLLVATYGILPDEKLIRKIKSKNKIVIEDFAHVHFPKTETSIIADARYYSFPKLLPVPDGGVLILKKTYEGGEEIAAADKVELSKQQISSSLSPRLRQGFGGRVKNWLKIFALSQYFISVIAIIRNKTITVIPKWQGIFDTSETTKRILYYYLTNEKMPWIIRDKYCNPILANNPRKAEKANLINGIISRRIWHDPIIYYTNEDIEKYPVTKYVAEHIICSPYF